MHSISRSRAQIRNSSSEKILRAALAVVDSQIGEQKQQRKACRHSKRHSKMRIWYLSAQDWAAVPEQAQRRLLPRLPRILAPSSLGPAPCHSRSNARGLTKRNLDSSSCGKYRIPSWSSTITASCRLQEICRSSKPLLWQMN